LKTNERALNWGQRLFGSFSIAQKIGYGYSLAIGIAVIGATVGLVSGDRYKREAQSRLMVAYQQQYLLSELENSALGLRSHPQALVAVMAKPIWFDYETKKFLSKLRQARSLMAELNTFIDQHPDRLALKNTELKRVLQNYETTIGAYAQFIESLWQKFDPAKLDREELPAAQQQLLDAFRSREAVKLNTQFDRISESLSLVMKTAIEQQNLANQELIRASVLRLQIIITSLAVSAFIAAAMAFYTSRAIARPLKAVKQVAQQVTQDANFDLQVEVLTQDEVGSLARSLNQLIQWIGDYTQKLTFSSQMLEKRNQDLAQALQELQQTQTQLIQTEKMSSLGQMVAGIAHEINNPVNFICGNLFYAEDGIQSLLAAIALYQSHCVPLTSELETKLEDLDLEFLKSDLPKLITSMRLGTERIQKIVLSLRNFSRLDESAIKAVDLHEGIDNTLLILNHRFKKGVEAIKHYGDLPLVACYPAQLNQVFMNIITNALDAMLEDDLQPKHLTIQTEKVADNQVQVKIKDSGPGMPPEVQKKLFEPFFTTKPVGKGTGLGMSICYQIVEKHQGRIEVNSAPGKGTEFAIALPIHQNN